MDSIMIAIGCILIMLIPSRLPQSEGWRGIVPLHSTCEDAKRLLGVSKCETGSYDFKDERAFIWFAKKPCADGWNVRRGTVTSIEIFPKRKLHLAELGSDERTFRKVMSQSHYDTDSFITEEQSWVVTAYPTG